MLPTTNNITTNITQPNMLTSIPTVFFIIIYRTFTCSLHLINTNNICVMQCNTDIGRPRQNCNIINVISLRFGICLTGDFKMGSSTRGYNSHTSPLILTYIIFEYYLFSFIIFINFSRFDVFFIFIYIHYYFILIIIINNSSLFSFISSYINSSSSNINSSSSNIKIITSFNNLFSYNSTRSVFIIFIIKYNFNIKYNFLFIIIYNIILYYIK